MARIPGYSDEELAVAIAAASSWRGVLRQLGLAGTSGNAIRALRSRADRVGADYEHFRGQRRWSDAQITEAVRVARKWSDVVERLDLQSDAALATVIGHAARIGLDVARLDVRSPALPRHAPTPQLRHLARAGALLAASWYSLCGWDVSWPLEPSRYDLLVNDGATVRRVQVKTTTVRVADSWKVYLSTAGRERKTYSAHEIDEFFVIDGDLNCYLIPLASVGGLQAIHLRAYESFRLPSAWRILGPAGAEAAAPRTLWPSSTEGVHVSQDEHAAQHHVPSPGEPSIPELEADQTEAPRPEEEIADALRAEPDARRGDSTHE
ncbi:hypothetical protein EDD26_2003 [Agrococcus jenensis]|uniref:PD(D/E)XK endonuclease domain-containing protein n=2 Tax=Agrococcus jenensis TaxID=46353 RepID=A0A3N2AUA0_9MICO|nr:hypothetical protein EDD26_2003 [Agrococcus jenensis]